MPCRYDPSPEEERQIRNNQIKNITKPLQDKLDKLTCLLCFACKELNQGGYFLKISNPDRELTKWWEEHQKADKKREKEEREKHRNSGLNKLTEEEKKALGLK
jgi:hypothetical protein